MRVVKLLTLATGIAVAASLGCASRPSYLGRDDDGGVAERVELILRDAEPSVAVTEGRLALTDGDGQSPGGSFLGEELDDLLPSFLRAAETSIVARFVGEGPLVSADAAAVREVVLRQTMGADTESAERTFEACFRLLPSESRRAVRVRLEGLEVPRSDAHETLWAEEAVPIVLTFTLRYVVEESSAVRSHTVLFQDTIDTTEGDYRGDPQTSDWIPLEVGHAPYSIEAAAVAREELSTFAKAVQGTGASLLGLLRAGKRAGVL